MSTRVPLENTMHTLQLKEQLDEVVFNYIDTAQNWEVAYSKLDKLLEEATVYFHEYMEASGDQPKGNTTAIIFLNVAYKLIYFHTISHYHLKDTNQQAVKENALELLTLAAKCIPDVKKENHAEYLTEIAKSYEKISQVEGKQKEFEQAILEQNTSVSDCFTAFSKALKLFQK